MGGKSKKVTTGYRYQVAWHMGLGVAIDALLDMRIAEKTAWSGRQAATGTIRVDQPELLGGDKDQGGIVGDMDVLLGMPDQQPSGYLKSTFGAKVPAWRGLATLAWKGGILGSNNPYPQQPDFLVEAIQNGWGSHQDATECWYPEKAAIDVNAQQLSGDWEYAVLPYHDDPGHTNLTPPVDGWQNGGPLPYRSQGNWPYPTPAGWETPNLSVIWIRKTVTFGAGTVGLKIKLAADNGCVLFVNGQLVGTSNPDNDDISGNERFPVEFTVPAAGTYTFLGKAYSESSASHQGGNYVNVEAESITGAMINPAHALYLLKTHPDYGQLPPELMDDASCRAAADWFHARGFGICTEYDPSAESVDECIQRIGRVANLTLSRNPTDGKWYMDIANGEYDRETLPVLGDDDILDWDEQPSILDQAANTVSVEYYDPVTDMIGTTAPVQAMALVDTFGERPSVIQYHELPTQDLAAQVAQRELIKNVTPTHGYQIVASHRIHTWRRGTYFRLQSRRMGIADMVCLLGDVDRGTLKSGAVRLTATEDIFTMPTTSFVHVEPGEDTSAPQTPEAAPDEAVIEAPYAMLAAIMSRDDLAALDPDDAYLMTLAADPGRMRDYRIVTSVDGGQNYAGQASAEFCAAATVTTADDLTGTAPVSAVALDHITHGELMAAGQAALWDGELVRIDAVDTEAGTATLARGCVDTVPAAHAAGGQLLVLGDTVGHDDETYTTDETIDVKLLVHTGSQELALDAAPTHTLTFAGRAMLPYPPGRLRIDGDPYPASVSGEFTVTWAHRNRVAQADKLVDSAMGDVTPADNIRYRLTLKDDADSVLVTRDDIGPGTADVELVAAGDITLELSTIDPYGESMQKHVVTFAYTPAATPPGEPTITATAYTPVDDSIVIDGGDADGN